MSHLLVSTVDEFRRAMEAAGLIPPHRLEPGRIVRFPGAGKSNGNKSGWAWLAEDEQAGAFGDWSTGLSDTWHADRSTPMTASEHAAHKRRVAELQRIRQEEAAKAHAAAAVHAQEQWNAAQLASEDHPYLKRKRVKAHSLRIDSDNRLMVPVRIDGAISSLQFISSDGDKQFLPGGEVKGGYVVLGDMAQASTIALTEGFATGASVYEATGLPTVVAFTAGNLKPVAEKLRAQCATTIILVCADDDWQTPENPGRTKAREAVEAVGGVLALPNFGPSRPADATDFNDLMLLRGPDALRRTITGALAQAESVTRETELARLAILSPAEYGRERHTASDRLKIPLAFLDEERQQRQRTEKRMTVGQVIAFPDVPASSNLVNGTELVEHLMTVFHRYAILPAHGAIVLTLWNIFTYCFDEFEIAPRLILKSPEKRCGKTTILSLLYRLVCRSLLSSNVSPAVIFRVISAHRPTLLIDEMDTFARANEELRGILNSGHTRDGATVIRTVGDDHEPRAFSTWAPMAFACIGDLPGTLEDRGIILAMQRKSASESVTPLRKIGPVAQGLHTELQQLKAQITRWVGDHRSQLHRVDPSIPDGLHDRAKDNWTPLLTIAEVLGEPWQTRAAQAALALSGNSMVDNESHRVQLLADLRRLFNGTTADRLSSEDLCFQLAQLEERPWSEWKKGKPITQAQLASLLRPFDVRSRDLRLADGAVRKGYYFDDFQDAFTRYLPLSPTDSPISKRYDATTRSSPGDSPLFQGATTGPCSASEKGLNPAPGAECSAVAVQNQESGDEEIVFEEHHATGSH